MRHIIFNGYSSEDKGLTMSGSTPISQPAPKISGTEIELADGYIDTSRIDGKLHYKTRGIGYAFTYVIDAYNQYDLAKDPLQMNKEAIEVEHDIREWLLAETDRKLYDTAYGDPDSEDKGYYFYNASVQSINMTKAMGQDKWVLQFQVAFACDPYMYEIGADPKEFVMFAGPTEDAAEEGMVKIRIYNRGTDQRMLWCNDNKQVINAYELTRYSEDLSKLTVQLTFKPAASGLYTGPIGFYLNHYFDFTFNNTTYSYHIDADSINFQRGVLTWVDSTKLVTQKEFGYTDETGFILTFDVYCTNGLSLQQLSNRNSHNIPFTMVWGTARIFETDLSQAYIMTGVTKGDHSFDMVTGTDGHGGILTTNIPFEQPFIFDSDPYNELRMSSNNFGFYTLANEDTLKRRL